MGFWSALAKGAGAVGGFVAGGPGGAMAGYQLANALTSGGGDQPSPASDPSSSQDALNKSTKAAADYALPGFKQTLQGISEGAQARGVENGSIPVDQQNKASSDFQDHIAQALASNALDVHYGDLDRQQAQANAASQRQSSMIGAGLNLAGTLGGAYLSSRGNQPQQPADPYFTSANRPKVQSSLGTRSFADALRG